MKLETAGYLASQNVTVAELDNAFQDAVGRGEFIILSQSDQVYIQAAGEGESSYFVEYRAGDAKHHFRCTEDVSKKEVHALFMKYLAGDSSWKTDLAWEADLERSQVENKPWWKFW